MPDPETTARVEEVRRALRRLLELLARELVQDLFCEATPSVVTDTKSVPQTIPTRRGNQMRRRQKGSHS